VSFTLETHVLTLEPDSQQCVNLTAT